MRIAVNSRLLVPGKMDGIARFTLESFKRICAAHPEVEFTFIYDRRPPNINFGNNTRNVGISPPARHPILWYIWFEHRLKQYLNKQKFDLFISPEGWVPASLKMKSLAVIHDLNFIHQPENLIFSHRSFLRFYFPKYAKRADRIATVSEYSKADIIKSLGIQTDNIDVVYNGVNENFSAISESEKIEIRNEYSEGNEYFIFVGTLHPRKNLEHLFLGFDQFKKQNNAKHKLLIVGNKKWWPESIEEIYSSMEFQKDIIFQGRCEDDILSKLLSASTALTYLPYFEGFGIPILEAFQCHTAVITADNTSLPEVAGDAAIICNARDVKAISSAMKKISANESLRKELILKGIEKVKEYNWQKTSDLLWQSAVRCLDC